MTLVKECLGIMNHVSLLTTLRQRSHDQRYQPITDGLLSCQIPGLIVRIGIGVIFHFIVFTDKKMKYLNDRL